MCVLEYFSGLFLSRIRTPLRSEDDHDVTLSSELEKTDINMHFLKKKTAPLHGTTSLHVLAYAICAFVADTDEGGLYHATPLRRCYQTAVT